jgi:hypothetical protein
VFAEGSPVTGVDVMFTSNSNGTFTAIREDGNGYYRANYTAPANTSLSAVTINVYASATGCLGASGTALVRVSAPPVPVTNQTANAATRTLTLQVLDINGNPIADAQVFSATQPAGITQLTGTTNETGCATFHGVKAGYYAFDIQKDGYNPLQQSVSYNGTKITFTLSQTPADNTLFIIAPIVAVALIVAIAVTVIKKRRKGGSSSKGLQPLNWPMPS